MKALLFPALVLLLTLRLRTLDSARNRARDVGSRALATTVGRRVPSLTVVGSPMPDSIGRWRLVDPTIDGETFAGDVVVGADVLGKDPGFGRRVAVTGPFRPSEIRRNPGRVADGMDLFRPPRLTGAGRRFRAMVLPEEASWISRVPWTFARWRERAFRDTPGLLALEDVLWAGDDRRIGETLRELYREGGMFHLIALSGARVAVLAHLLALLPFGRWWRACLPTLACAILWVTSGGAAPVRRLLPMAIAFLVLRGRRWATSRVQMIASAVALAIVLDPSLVARPGFLLSAVGGAMLLQVGSYLSLVSVMPLLMFPLTAFFWAKVGLLAPLYCLALTWLWDFFWVPVGFLLPLVVNWIRLDALEMLWRVGTQIQIATVTRLGTAYVSVVRPTILELCVFVLAIAFWRKER